MKKYYLLEVGDILKDGDEEYNTCGDGGLWSPVPASFIEEPVVVNDPPTRRPIPEEDHMWTTESVTAWLDEYYGERPQLTPPERGKLGYRVPTVVQHAIFGILLHIQMEE